MKKLVAIFLLITGFANAQIMVTPDGHPRFPKKGVADTIVATDTILISKVKGEVFGIAYPDFIDGIAGVSSFGDLTGSPEDNTALAASLNLKADDAEVVKTDAASRVQNIDVWMGNKDQFAIDNPTNDIVFITDSIPATFTENKVIVDGAGKVFFNNPIIIPESANYVEESAFRNLGVSALDLSTTLDSIQDWAFAENNIKSITLPTDLQSIGEYSFYSNRITGSLTIPNSVTRIKRNAFTTNRLTSVTLPTGLTAIEQGILSGNKLTSITIPSPVTYIGSSAFSSNELTTVTYAGSSVDSIAQSAFSGNNFSSVIIPEGVRYIGQSAFNNLNTITSVTLPSTLKRMLINSFYSGGSPSALTNISLPSTCYIDTGFLWTAATTDVDWFLVGTNLYTASNAANFDAEANATTGVSAASNSVATTITSVTEPDTGTYAIRSASAVSGVNSVKISLTGLVDTKEYILTLRIKNEDTDEETYTRVSQTITTSGTLTQLPENLDRSTYDENDLPSDGYLGYYNKLIPPAGATEVDIYIYQTYPTGGGSFLIDSIILSEYTE